MRRFAPNGGRLSRDRFAVSNQASGSDQSYALNPNTRQSVPHRAGEIRRGARSDAL